MLVGGKWKPIILYYLALGPKRFGEIDVRINGLSRKVLTEQLKELERDGFVTRKAYRESPPRVEYELTAEGSSLSNVFDSMEAWVNQYKEKMS
ncbi:winged helix-turn-helix transcriptional regulator [Pedobacter antarcticus]|nr:helix-turn-helix domain-containing protein [Pedobacter antarcticus]SDL85996.1 transcriptional regulator, HxlR family [Pedobacter antarcticus]SFF04398.1 transcriptional regulator, HxlR family [Pedobacter antarcticus]